MIRVAVHAYLMIAAFVGPGLCLCTSVRWARANCGDDRTEASRPRATCGSHHSGHGCHSHRTKESTEDEKQSNPCSPPDDPACPCNDHSTIPVTRLPVEVDGARQLAEMFDLVWRGDSVADLEFVAIATISPVAGLSQGLVFGLYENGAEILRAHHILRR